LANPLGGLVVPAPLRDCLAEVLEPAAWTVLSAGVLSLRLPVGSRPTVAAILRVDRGSSLAAHRHTNRELILGLQGAFSEEAGPGSVRGGSFAVGDLGEFGCGSARAVVAGNAGCIMLQGFGRAGDAADGKLSRTLPAR
jgi:putative transcriptional regulator